MQGDAVSSALRRVYELQQESDRCFARLRKAAGVGALHSSNAPVSDDEEILDQLRSRLTRLESQLKACRLSEGASAEERKAALSQMDAARRDLLASARHCAPYAVLTQSLVQSVRGYCEVSPSEIITPRVGGTWGPRPALHSGGGGTPGTMGAGGGGGSGLRDSYRAGTSSVRSSMDLSAPQAARQSHNGLQHHPNGTNGGGGGHQAAAASPQASAPQGRIRCRPAGSPEDGSDAAVDPSASMDVSSFRHDDVSPLRQVRRSLLIDRAAVARDGDDSDDDGEEEVSSSARAVPHPGGQGDGAGEEGDDEEGEDAGDDGGGGVDEPLQFFARRPDPVLRLLDDDGGGAGGGGTGGVAARPERYHSPNNSLVMARSQHAAAAAAATAATAAAAAGAHQREAARMRGGTRTSSDHRSSDASSMPLWHSVVDPVEVDFARSESFDDRASWRNNSTTSRRSGGLGSWLWRATRTVVSVGAAAIAIALLALAFSTEGGNEERSAPPSAPPSRGVAVVSAAPISPAAAAVLAQQRRSREAELLGRGMRAEMEPAPLVATLPLRALPDIRDTRG